MTTAIPVDAVTNVQFRLEAAFGAAISPFTGQRQNQDWGGRWWMFEIEFGPQRGDDGLALSAFLTALQLRADKLTFANPGFARTESLGTPQVNGAGQTGTSLVTDGWNNSTDVLKAGHFISLGSGDNTRLHQVTANVSSNGSGQATIPIVPALRSEPADNAGIEYQNPSVLLELESPVPQQMRSGVFYEFSISCREPV